MPSFFLVTGLLLVVKSLAAPTDAASPPRCKEVTFTVSASAENYAEPDVYVLNPTNLTQAVDNATDTLAAVSGPQTFAGWFCLPTVTNANSTKLQFFRGSFFTNREYWTALGGTALYNPPLAPYEPNMYSWFEYANNLGYPTLAIDTLGDGLSSSPDPILVTQIPYQVQLNHALVTQIRAGTTQQLPTAYSYIAYVGNSLGSTLGNNIAALYPQDFNTFVLTGFSKDVFTSLPGVSLNLPAPAALVEPTRFAGKPLGYVTSTSQTALTNSFFGNPEYVDFDPEIAALFFQRRDTVSLGDVITIYTPATVPIASSYTGRVLVLTGEHDQAYCGLGSSAIDPDNQCGALLKDTGVLFPAADYNYQSVPRTGHALFLHESAQYIFYVAHSFLAGAHYGS